MFAKTALCRILFAATVSVALLSACTHASRHTATINKAASAKQEQAAKQQRIAQLQAQIKQHQDQAKADQKQLPDLLSQSDAALEKIRAYKKALAATKDKKAVADFQKQIDQFQGQADARAAQIVNTRQDLYAQFDTIADLKQQISQLSGNDEAAKSVAARDIDGNGGEGAAAKDSARTHHKHSSRIAKRSAGTHM